jgi:Acetyltransferase (GNAT) domain
VKDSDYENFTSLYTFLAQRQQVETYGIFLKGQLISTAAYFFSHKRAYYIMAGNHPDGKTVGASHYLIDRFIADHANRDLVLDFEGSDISSLAFFYSSFGSTLKYFPALRINRLPWYVKWFK